MACNCNNQNVAGATVSSCPNVEGAQFACCGPNGPGVGGVTDTTDDCNLSTQDILLILGIVLLLICLFCNC